MYKKMSAGSMSKMSAGSMQMHMNNNKISAGNLNPDDLYHHFKKQGVHPSILNNLQKKNFFNDITNGVHLGARRLNNAYRHKQKPQYEDEKEPNEGGSLKKAKRKLSDWNLFCKKMMKQGYTMEECAKMYKQ